MIHTTRILCALIAITVFGCNDSAIDTNGQPSSASLSIRWRTSPEDTGFDPAVSRYALSDDCPAAGVDKVQCKVYGNGEELTAYTWNCADRKGTITDIPPGSDRRFVILGLDAEGQILYRGQSDQGHDCEPGKNTTVGYIDAIPFVPRLSTPVDGTLVNVVDPVLEWSDIGGDIEYHVTVSENSDFSDDTIEYDTSESSYMPSELAKTKIYYWCVSAVDEYNNTGKVSEIWSFSLAPYPLPDTGQMESYTETPGEDSDYDINPPSFTKLDTEGHELDDNALDWAMVRDNVTGLVWEVKKIGDGTIQGKDTTYNWQESKDIFINEINRNNFGGQNTWRLPTIRELATLVHHDAYDPTINKFYFPNTASEGYWSSTEVTQENDNVWCVWMREGLSTYAEKTADLRARAVYSESGNGYINQIFIDNENDGTVTDQMTGLMWQKEYKAGDTETGLNWQEALEYCEKLQLAGHDDWRLPTVRELQTIIDYQRIAPAIDRNYFSYVDDDVRPYPPFWTSTSFARPDHHDEAWFVYFQLGSYKPSEPKNEANALVRAVRSAN